MDNDRIRTRIKEMNDLHSQNLYDIIKQNKTYNPTNSVQWFTTNVTNALKNIGQQQYMSMVSSWQSKTIMPGTMVLYGYAPKHAKDLPQYDTFPLLLPFHVDGKYFTGLNLHYLPPIWRMKVLDFLMQTGLNKNMSDKKKILISWQFLKSVSISKAAQYSVHKYLHGYVKTRFITIPVSDWPITVFLPLARFKKKTEQQVHQEFYDFQGK